MAGNKSGRAPRSDTSRRPDDETPLREGLRAELLTAGLRDRQIDSLTADVPLELLTTPPGHGTGPRRSLPSDLQVRLLATHFARLLRIALSDDPGSEAAVGIINQLADTLFASVDGLDERDRPIFPVTRLDGVVSADKPLPPVPTLPLDSGQLLVAANGEPSLFDVIRAELPSAQSVDLICAFLKMSGIRLLKGALTDWIGRGGRLRVLTTTYLGATDVAAVEWLVANGAEVRVSHDTQNTRLHAKAWLFRREHGLSTALVGSSNLSRPAMLDGLEWNVRLVEQENPGMLERYLQVFDTYWDGHEFDELPALDNGRLPALGESLKCARGLGGSDDPRLALPGVSFTHLEVRPFAHQRLILEQLAIEREVHDRHRNLVEAATGTGKTIVAALDYRDLAVGWRRQVSRPEGAGLPSLLFIAHRQEILRQAIGSFRTVLGDGDFGELLVDGQLPSGSPDRWRHVFASIQSMAAERIAQLDPRQFDVVIVDEFHHAEADTYRRLLAYVEPRELLGLTATPERSDGQSVLGWFEHRIAAELRLWTAIEQGLLVPFHYFCLHDNVDLQTVKFGRGGYDVPALDRLYTGNDARVHLVLKQLREHVADMHRIRALGFCVSVAHAEYMAERFRVANLPSIALTGKDGTDARVRALNQLKSGELCCVFTVDLFNEGVDIPEVDTLLLLRPTESATLFQQQLGRGLRRHPDKSVLTVFDFVGTPAREFRFARRWQGFLGQTAAEIKQQVTSGFTSLPSGCAMQLDRQSQSIILDNLKQQLRNWADWKQDLQNRPAMPSLLDWLVDTGITLEQLYAAQGGRGSWLRLCADAGLNATDDASLASVARLRRLLHVNDTSRLDALAELSGLAAANDRGDSETADGDRGSAYRVGLSCQVANPPDDAAVSRLVRDAETHYWQSDAVAGEIASVMPVLRERVRCVGERISDDLPFVLHADYQRIEVLSALLVDPAEVDLKTWRSIQNFREGVRFFEDLNLDVAFVTIHKDGAAFKASTRYRDYAMTDNRFHWESQSTTSRASPTGRRYLGQADSESRLLLFVRRDGKSNEGTAVPFTCLGLADIVSARGERPIAMELALHRPMTEALREAFTLVI